MRFTQQLGKKEENAGEKIVNATNEGSNTFQTVRESLEWSNNIPASYHLYQDVLNFGGIETICLRARTW